VLVHGVVGALLWTIWPAIRPSPPLPRPDSGEAVAVTMLVDEASSADLSELDPLEEEPPEPVPEEEPEPEVKLPDGQVVETPAPQVEKVPEKADYLADHNNAVLEETKTDAFRVNPEVLSNQFSREDKLQFEDVADVNATEPSTGARVTGSAFDPAKDGPMAALASPFTLTNKDGLEKPVPASSRSQDLAGAPQNDLLNEKLGGATNLNTREWLGASYVNHIKRLVNFYWSQNLDNLPHDIRYARSRYSTVVYVVLDDQGALDSIDIIEPSGADPLDQAVISAFKMAGPFPNPPRQLVSKDGRVYLGDWGWTVELGRPRAPYVGIDPRSGVQFPGILKAPR
jgi:TonB family protein